MQKFMTMQEVENALNKKKDPHFTTREIMMIKTSVKYQQTM